MLNVFPGDGLGGNPSRLLADGLGSAIAEPVEALVDRNVYGGGGKAYVPRYEWDDIIGDIERRERIAQEDEEILEIIIEAIASGVTE